MEWVGIPIKMASAAHPERTDSYQNDVLRHLQYTASMRAGHTLAIRPATARSGWHTALAKACTLALGEVSGCGIAAWGLSHK